MSAGAFEDGKYESGNTFVYPVRVQPETKGLTLNSAANAYPDGALTANIGTLNLTGGRRRFGVIPRTVTVEMTAAPTGAVADYAGEGSQFTVPVFDPDVWSGYSKGQTGTYLGTAVKYINKSPEIIR
jgi:hypothetical protein